MKLYPERVTPAVSGYVHGVEFPLGKQAVVTPGIDDWHRA